MLSVVSPAKSLDFESALATRKHSQPAMLGDAAELISVMAAKSPDEIADLMSISPDLAELNFERFQTWEQPFTTKNARPALLAFNGDVYLGMDPSNTFGERDFTQAQKSLRILSGLYGVLRPLDLMQPYRLEMGSKVATDRGRDLYDYWGCRITDALNADIAASPGPDVLINLASNEYFGAVRRDKIEGRIISPVFLDRPAADSPGTGGEPRVVSFFAKRARGAMAGWLIRNRVKTMSGIKDFTEMDYEYDAERSSADRPTFVR